MSSNSGVDRLIASGRVPKSNDEAICLLFHSLLVDKGLVCVYEDGSSVPGFAAPIKELSKEYFLPKKWEYSKSKLMYKHPQRKGSLLEMATEFTADGQVKISLNESSGIKSTRIIAVGDYYVPDESIPKCYKNVVSLEEMINLMLLEVFPQIQSSNDILNQHKVLFESNNIAQQEIGHNVRVFANEVPVFYPSNPVPVAIAPSIGDRDLNPFPENKIFRNPYPIIDTNYQGNLIGPDHPCFFPTNTDPFAGQGNEFGPDHPYFFPQNTNPFPDSMLPQPRFDPFGPVVGPNGPDFGNNGMIGGGRGRGRGNGNGNGNGNVPRTFPGEPNPDHFRPPSNGFI